MEDVSGNPIDSLSPCAACAHERAVHEHCRPGTDCGLCGCDRFRLSVRAVLAGLMPRRRTAVTSRG